MDTKKHNQIQGVLQMYNIFKITTVILTMLSFLSMSSSLLMSLILITLSLITFYISIQLYISFREIYDEDINSLHSIISRKKFKFN